MCLSPPHLRKTRQKIAYKVLKWDEDRKCWVTPYYNLRARKTLIAAGNPRFSGITGSLGEGAIHCFKTYKEAYRCFGFMRPYQVFKIIGEEVIAHNARQIAFKKITFLEPLSKPKW